MCLVCALCVRGVCALCVHGVSALCVHGVSALCVHGVCLVCVWCVGTTYSVLLFVVCAACVCHQFCVHV